MGSYSSYTGLLNELQGGKGPFQTDDESQQRCYLANNTRNSRPRLSAHINKLVSRRFLTHLRQLSPLFNYCPWWLEATLQRPVTSWSGLPAATLSPCFQAYLQQLLSDKGREIKGEDNLKACRPINIRILSGFIIQIYSNLIRKKLLKNKEEGLDKLPKVYSVFTLFSFNAVYRIMH